MTDHIASARSLDLSERITIEIAIGDTDVTVRCGGDLDIATKAYVLVTLDAVRHHELPINLDLGGVDFCDWSSMASILAVDGLASAQAPLRFVSTSAPVDALLSAVADVSGTSAAA